MKKLILLSAILAFAATSYAKPGNLRAFWSYSTFNSPEAGPFVETYLSVLGNSVQFVVKDNGKFQGSIFVTMLFKQNDTIKAFRKYELFSPEVDDTTAINFSFLDQQRVPLPNGKYDIELSIADKNREMKPFLVKDQVDLDYPDGQARISDVQLIESFTKVEKPGQLTKSGYDFIPYLDNFFPQTVNKVTFYAEMYNMGQMLGNDDKFVVATSIESHETGKIVGENLRLKREMLKPVNVVFSEFDISALPSGNYDLVVTARDKENKELLRKSLFFQRSNPAIGYNSDDISAVIVANSFVAAYTNADSLREFIRMCYPVSSSNEKLFIDNQLKIASLETMQKFFMAFWQSRNALNPSGEWQQYYLQVLAVNEEFKTPSRKGYETERGRVYLQYGPPNTRFREYMDPSAWPYEIWHYYLIGTQSNGKFLFYSRDYANNDFVILNSNVKGEISNYRWEVDLHTRDTDRNNNPMDLDRTKESEYFSGKAREQWESTY